MTLIASGPIGEGTPTATATYLAIDRGSARYGVHARIVSSVISLREWNGREPFDIGDLLGVKPDSGEQELPLLVLASERGKVAMLSFGKIAFVQVDLASVQPLPSIVRSPNKSQLVSGIVLDQGERPLVVLDAVALLSIAERESNR